MKILVLTKRQYMGKDLLDDRFGRFRELPLELARLGHVIMGLATSYRQRSEGTAIDSDPPPNGQVIWQSFNLTNRFVPHLQQLFHRAIGIATEFNPDLIWACSDAYHAIFGAWLAERVRTKCVIDLYDNFEAFTATKIPGISSLFRRSTRRVQGVTCFSQLMADHVVQNYKRQKPTAVIESAVQKALFRSQDQGECRRRLKLPDEAHIIGTAGALHTSRGIDTLFQAYEHLAAENENLHLALAGPRERGVCIPNGPRVHDFGILPHDEVPCFINSLNVAVVCYRRSTQGDFSLPQKAYEMVACRVPLIAAAVGSMNEFLSKYPTCLYDPDRPKSLADAVRRQLQNKIIVNSEVPSWADSAKQLADFFEKVIQGDTTSTGTQPIAEIAR
jgi:teichuronic acid biosynthesis glycosyltransferase TuaC